MVEVGVVHLVRKKNGIAPFEKFLASYLEHPSGLPHDLVLIFKGFKSGRTTDAYDRLLAGVPHKRLYMSDYGLDLAPYFAAVQSFDYRYFCFLNSFSRILAVDWLAKLRRSIELEGVGLVGATGSYESFATNYLERKLMLSALGPVARLRWTVKRAISDSGPQLVALRLAIGLLGRVGLSDPGRYFPPFPNYHIRTNAFMALRETLTRVRVWKMVFKVSGYVFESGRNSLTNQILRLGLRPLVVARTGESFEKEQWHLSNTFRQSAQENLLVADNQTDAYAQADGEERIKLSRQAWGPFARPF